MTVSRMFRFGIEIQKTGKFFAKSKRSYSCQPLQTQYLTLFIPRILLWADEKGFDSPYQAAKKLLYIVINLKGSKLPGQPWVKLENLSQSENCRKPIVLLRRTCALAPLASSLILTKFVHLSLTSTVSAH
jgi:hypothetical protein